jgi:ABC-type methionine transport system ATPase subunit
VTDTDFDLDDEPVLTAEGEVAAAICGHQIVMQRGDALTADRLDEFHGFVQEELAALLEEKNAEIAYLRAIANCKFAGAAQMRLHHAGLEEDKTFVFITAHLAAQFKAVGATHYVQIEVNHEELGPLTLTIQRQSGRRRYPQLTLSIGSVDG